MTTQILAPTKTIRTPGIFLGTTQYNIEAISQNSIL